MTRKIDHSKNIRKLKLNAKKDNFFSIIQLRDYYLSGRYVEQNENTANVYLQKAYSLFKNQNIKIKEIHIENFRVFDSLRIDCFDSNINIIVGNNGAGKTSLLDAIDLSLSWLRNSITKNGGGGTYIEEVDINYYSDLPYSHVSTILEINPLIEVPIELSKSRDGRVKRKNHLVDFRTIGEFYKTSNEIDNNFNMPLLSYYNVMRSYDVNPKDIKLDDKSEVTDKFDAYHNSLSGKTDFQGFFRWYKRLDDILSRRENKKTRAETLNELGISEDFIKSLESLAIDDEQTNNTLNRIKELINKKTRQNEYGDEDDNYNKIFHTKLIINKVISNFMDGYSNLEVQVEPYLDLVITKNKRKISVLRLSQGEKTLLALVIDIARRLIVLNPSLPNPLDGQGIILIDEFDLHLHPKWQREIAKNLQITFPNCQFFMTTHSPLILGEVKPNQIFILEDSEDKSISLRHPSQSYGLTSNDILNELMNNSIENVPLDRSMEVELQLREIFELISISTSQSLSRAREKIVELEKSTFGEIPELVKAKVEIEFLEEFDSSENSTSEEENEGDK